MMQAAVVVPSILETPGTSSSCRVPRRTSSYLSLKKSKSSSSFDPHGETDTSTCPSPTKSDFSEPFSRSPVTPRPRLKVKIQRTASEQMSHHERTGSRVTPSREQSYAFPLYDDVEDVVAPVTPKQCSRTRSFTGNSASSQAPLSPVPALQFSNSTSTQHTVTPLQTPIDLIPSQESSERFSVVAAPISGVETMDALVDGMNGEDDCFSDTTGVNGRTRFGGIPGHHPLYQPPLPIPPPGVILGGGKSRRSKTPLPSKPSSDSGSSVDDIPTSVSTSLRRRRRSRHAPLRVPSDPTLGSSPSTSTHMQDIMKSGPTNTDGPHQKMSDQKFSSVVPSISDIIRAHAPPGSQIRSRPSTARSYYAQSHRNGAICHEREPETCTLEDELDMISRSSIDSVADEVQRTLRIQNLMNPRPPPAPPSSFPKRHSTISDSASIFSPSSDPGVGSSSVYSFSISSNGHHPSRFDAKSLNSIAKPLSTLSSSQEVAEYLRSARLTSLLHLTRSPHASQDNPLTVSFSDLGCPSGHPVVVFLGLGCVRHVMGLYDEMAEVLNIRLITIDRWGLGRTEPRPKSVKGVIQWASVVEEVLDHLQIEECSVIAHSAGAPYALSFANKVPKRIRGDVCLMAPWVGGTDSNGYKWLRYVPNGILKTAQAAEWKVQAWMLGKPPTVVYEGIEYRAPSVMLDKRNSSLRSNLEVPSLHMESIPRPSIGSSTFSEYDDLRDFDGRFESRSTLGARPSENTGKPANDRKTSKGFLTRFKGSSSPPLEEKSISSGRTLKALRSMSSLKGKTSTKKFERQLELPSLQVEANFGPNDSEWTRSKPATDEPAKRTLSGKSDSSFDSSGRSNGRRSMSFSYQTPTSSLPASPSFSTAYSSSSASVRSGGTAFQAALGSALIAASHAESAKGTHNDLLQILNHENHPWGFCYSNYPHFVKVWYGDKDEKIAENAVRWMARTMGEDHCTLKILKGAGHGLLYRSTVVIEVFEHVLSFWKSEKC